MTSDWCRRERRCGTVRLSHIGRRTRHEVVTSTSTDELKGATVSASSTEGIKIVLHPVSDLERAKGLYSALLGVEPQADAPYYVGYDAPGQHIGLVPADDAGGTKSPVCYWSVTDIEKKLAEVTSAGATVKDPPREVGWGRVVATFTDLDGNVLGLVQDPESAASAHDSSARR